MSNLRKHVQVGSRTWLFYFYKYCINACNREYITMRQYTHFTMYLSVMFIFTMVNMNTSI